MAVKVDNHASFEDALDTFTKNCKPILKEAEKRKHFVPDREKHHYRGKGHKNK